MGLIFGSFGVSFRVSFSWLFRNGYGEGSKPIFNPQIVPKTAPGRPPKPAPKRKGENADFRQLSHVFGCFFAPNLEPETLPKAVQKSFRNGVQRKTRKRFEKDPQMGQLGPPNRARKRLKWAPQRASNLEPNHGGRPGAPGRRPGRPLGAHSPGANPGVPLSPRAREPLYSSFL